MPDIDVIMSRLRRVRRSGAGWIAECPAHPDKTPSLSIREGQDGRVLLYCFGGCTTADVLSASNLRWSDLFPEDTTAGNP